MIFKLQGKSNFCKRRGNWQILWSNAGQRIAQPAAKDETEWVRSRTVVSGRVPSRENYAVPHVRRRFASSRIAMTSWIMTSWSSRTLREVCVSCVSLIVNWCSHSGWTAPSSSSSSSWELSIAVAAAAVPHRANNLTRETIYRLTTSPSATHSSYSNWKRLDKLVGRNGTQPVQINPKTAVFTQQFSAMFRSQRSSKHRRKIVTQYWGCFTINLNSSDNISVFLQSMNQWISTVSLFTS